MNTSTATSPDDYGWSDTTAPHTCAYLAPQVLAVLGRLRAQRVLDLGAGNGALCRILRDAGLKVVGVEHDARGVAIARAALPDVPFYCEGVEGDPAFVLTEQAAFDAVVSTEVIEHLYSPHLLPRYAAALLNQGGHLIVTTPYHGYLKNLALALTGHWDSHFTAMWHGGHIKFWSRATLTLLLQENGFDVVGFQGVGRVPGLWKSMLLVARKL
jgi:2-polyprenyl-6-hydroxyphenyl methylase/3-demethylubiquinone-9 3-methyltransferase